MNLVHLLFIASVSNRVSRRYETLRDIFVKKVAQSLSLCYVAGLETVVHPRVYTNNNVRLR